MIFQRDFNILLTLFIILYIPVLDLIDDPPLSKPKKCIFYCSGVCYQLEQRTAHVTAHI